MQLPKQNEIWRHYKGPTYVILGLGYDEDGMPVVIYADNVEPLRGPCSYYTRRLGTFLQTVDYEGSKVQRFKITANRRAVRPGSETVFDKESA